MISTRNTYFLIIFFIAALGTINSQSNALIGKEKFYIKTIDSLKDIRDYASAINFYQNISRSSLEFSPKTKTSLYSKVASIYYLQGDYHEALKLYNKTIKTCRENKFACTRALSNTGAIHNQLGDYDKALKIFIETKNIYHHQGNTKDSIRAMHHIGYLLNKVGLYDNSLAYYNIVLQHHSKENNNPTLIKNAFESIGELYVKTRKINLAHQFFLESLKLSKTLKEKKSINAQIGLAEVYIHRNQLNESKEILDKVKKTIASKGHVRTESKISYLNAIIHSKKGLYDVSLQFNDTSTQINKDLNLKLDLINNYKTYSEVYAKMGKWELANDYILKQDSLKKKLFSPKSFFSLCKKILQIDRFENKNDNKKESTFFNWGYTITLPALLLFITGFATMNKKKMKVRKFLRSHNNKPLLSENEISNIDSELNQILIHEKSYTDQNLTLGKLAEKINTTDKKLSYYLNRKRHTKFYLFINKYRVAESKKMLVDSIYKNLSIEGVSQECGFKSRSAFYKAFKEETGLTPKEYQKLNST